MNDKQHRVCGDKICQDHQIKPGLSRIKHVLNRLDNPQDKLLFVHVAGTNGKGSVLSYIAAVLKEAGYRTGVFSSPAVFDTREMFAINGKWISESDYAKHMTVLDSIVIGMEEEGRDLPSQYELYTALAFQYFACEKVDIVLLETCMGGAWDTTNVISDSLCDIITVIGMDHQEYLGHSIEEIAWQKAGIIKKGTDVILYSQNQPIYAIMKRMCQRQESALIEVDFDGIQQLSCSDKEQIFHYKRYDHLLIKQMGSFQVKNAVTAIEAIHVLINKGFAITEEHIRAGLENARWHGRFELISERPLFIIDGAHNVDGVKVLKESLLHLYAHKKIIFIMGVFADKDYVTMAAEILSLGVHLIAVRLPEPRGVAPDRLAEVSHDYIRHITTAECVEDAIRQAFVLEKKISDAMIVAFGSLSYMSSILKMIYEG